MPGALGAGAAQLVAPATETAVHPPPIPTETDTVVTPAFAPTETCTTPEDGGGGPEGPGDLVPPGGAGAATTTVTGADGPAGAVGDGVTVMVAMGPAAPTGAAGMAVDAGSNSWMLGADAGASA
jgi:hypothetical protein